MDRSKFITQAAMKNATKPVWDKTTVLLKNGTKVWLGKVFNFYVEII
jgi:hypothetical protein